MRVLITGANGFIAHNLVKYFVENTDWTIYANWRSNTQNIVSHERVVLFQADLRDIFDLSLPIRVEQAKIYPPSVVWCIAFKLTP